MKGEQSPFSYIRVGDKAQWVGIFNYFVLHFTHSYVCFRWCITPNHLSINYLFITKCPEYGHINSINMKNIIELKVSDDNWYLLVYCNGRYVGNIGNTIDYQYDLSSLLEREGIVL